MDGLDTLSHTLVTRSVNFHGHQLLKQLTTTHPKDLGTLNMKEVDYKVYKARLPEISKQPTVARNELINFINDKCTGLFNNQEEKSPASDDDYGVKDRSDNLPPLEYFMNVMGTLKKDVFFKTVERGDVLYVRVSSHLHELLSVVRVHVSVGTTVRDLFHADIKAHLRLENTDPEPADSDDRGRWMLRTRLCVEVLEVDANDNYLLVGTKGVAIKPHLKDKVKLGKSTIKNLPPILSEMEDRSIKSYSQAMEKLVTFNNPRSIRHLAGKFNISIYSHSSLMDSLKFKFPESEMYKSVRKSQMSRWAHKSVADGVVFFKRGQHEEAFQCLNKALQIDSENVEAFVAKGALLANFGSLEKAVENFEEALKYNPSHNNAQKYICETLVELAKQHQEENRMEQAEENYKRCLSIKPEHKEAKEALRKITKKRENRSNIVQDVLQDLMEIEEEFNRRKRHQSSSTSRSSPNRDSPVFSQDTRDSAQDPDKISQSRSRSQSKSLSPLSTKMAMQQGNWQPPSAINTVASFIPSTNSAVPSHSIDTNFNYPPTGWGSTSLVSDPSPPTSMISTLPDSISIMTRPHSSTPVMNPLPGSIGMATHLPPQTPMVIGPSVPTSLVTGQAPMTSIVSVPPPSTLYPNTLAFTVPPPEISTNSSTKSKSISKEDEEYKARVDQFLKDLEGVRPIEKKEPPKKRSKGRESRGKKKHKDSHKKRNRSSSTSSATRSRSRSYSSSSTSSSSSSSSTISSSSTYSSKSSSSGNIDNKKTKRKRHHKKHKKPMKKEKKKNEKSIKKEPVKEKSKTKVPPDSTVDDDPIPELDSLNEILTAYYKKVEESQKESKEMAFKTIEKESSDKERSSDNYDVLQQTLKVMKNYEQGFRLTKSKVGTDSGRPSKGIHPAFQDSDDEVFYEPKLNIWAKTKKSEPTTSRNVMEPVVTTNTKSDMIKNTVSQKGLFTSDSWNYQGSIPKKLSRSRSRSRSKSLPKSHSKSHSRSRSRIGSRSQSREHDRSRSRSFSRDRSPVFTYKRSRSRSPAKSSYKSGYRGRGYNKFRGSNSNRGTKKSRGRERFLNSRGKPTFDRNEKSESRDNPRDRMSPEPLSEQERSLMIETARKKLQETIKFGSVKPINMLESTNNFPAPKVEFSRPKTPSRWESSRPKTPSRWESSRPKTPSRWESSRPKTPSRWESSRPKTPSRWESSRPKTPSRWESSRPKTPSRWEASRPKTPSRWDSSHPKKSSRWDSSRPKTPSRWESSRPKTPSRWESSRPKTPSKGFKRSRDDAFNDFSSNERAERFGKWDDVDKEKNVESKIGNSLTEMETFLQIAKQKKMEEMKERNKQFLKPNID